MFSKRGIRRLKRIVPVCVVAVASAVVVSVTGQTPRPATTAKAAPANDKQPVEWRDYAGSPAGSRYVPLNEIAKDNVDKLDVAWTYPHAETGFNAIVAHGFVYTRARNKSIVALDAATGKEMWIHDGLTGMTERGMNYWESKDGSDRRLIFELGDYLQELDARTGKIVRSFGKNGAVDLKDAFTDRDKNAVRGSSGTPGKVFEDLLLLGSATGEGYFSGPGDLRAYNVVTGKLEWTFHTIPRPGEYGYDTWPKDAWKWAGGANTWGEISVDAERGIAYFPTGSSTYDYYGADRVGNDLFANCLIALDARTGKRLWHFQSVHHDLWDFDNVSAPMLTTIVQNGKKRDVVAMAGKTNFLYVFDRVTGEPIWPITEKPVPTQTEVPGEKYSATQPVPTVPPPFGPQTFSPDDVNPYILTPEQRASFKDRVASARNEGIFTPIGFSEVVHVPGNHGGSNWGSTSSNPTDGTVYVISFDVPALMKLNKPGEGGRGGGRGAAGGGVPGPGAQVYGQNCAACHGPDRAGSASVPSLAGVQTRLTADQIRLIIQDGRNQMPGFHSLTQESMTALVDYLVAPEPPAGAAGGGRGGRGGAAGPAPTFPPGPIVETGPAATRPGDAGGRGGAANADYPDDTDHPSQRLQSAGYGLNLGISKPPYTALTAYDLNTGTIKWRIGVGDDYRVTSAGGPTGTGAAEFIKGSVISTSSGLIFVNAADHRLHIYDAQTGKHLRALPFGATTSGSPSMYELGGRQYLLVSASTVGTRGGSDDGKAVDPNQTGPIGLTAFAIKK